MLGCNCVRGRTGSASIDIAELTGKLGVFPVALKGLPQEIQPWKSVSRHARYMCQAFENSEPKRYVIIPKLGP